MNKSKSIFNKFLSFISEFFRKFLVLLKKNPNYIPFVMLLVSFLVYSLNLTSVSNTTATVQGKGMGLCEFAAMLFSILSMIALLNAFPKRQKPNYPMVVLIIALFGIIIFADITYASRVYDALVELGDKIKPKQLEEYVKTYNMIYTHIALIAVTAVTVVLEPLFAKLLKKINTTVNLEETSIGDIELVDEE